MHLDPWLFDPAAVSDETRAVADEVEALIAEQPSLTTFPPDVLRRAREEGKSVWGPLAVSDLAEDRDVDTPAGPLRLRILTPERVDGVYLSIHGGGWVLGGAHHQDERLEHLATRANVAVVSVEYRLAPEHPYPAALDDCEAAARWLIEHAVHEFGTDRLVIGGDSAGAHLSVTTLLRLRDRDGSHPFLGANLVYGVFDVAQTPSAANWGDRELVLSSPIMRWFADHFVPDADRRRDPVVSPLWADLHGMPPALFTVGTLDPLLDDSLFMAARWTAGGARAEMAIYPGAVHGFIGLPRRHAVAEDAKGRIARFVRDTVGPAAQPA